MAHLPPRLLIAGLAGDSGKTLLCLGLIRALSERGLKIAPFKKGPDFIDAAWLGAAAGVCGRNLDTFMMPENAILRSLALAGQRADLALVEGNRGLFDGLDAKGSHSSAALARLSGSPIVLIVDVSKTTRTVAAQVLGCQQMEQGVALAGVVLNRVGTKRQEALIREAIEERCGLRVLGAIPRLNTQELPSRHLGLLTAIEHPDRERAIETAAQVVRDHVDLQATVDIAERSLSMKVDLGNSDVKFPLKCRIGLLRDKAFSFYYPENIEALEQAGAELVTISPLADESLPPIDALYAGGGFPEEHAAGLSANEKFKGLLADCIRRGLPVWAECGGLMYLSRALLKDGTSYPMAGALPIVVEHTPRPQGHGYTQARVDESNPFIAVGTVLRGHEFHYSKITEAPVNLKTVMAMDRGTGIGDGRDGIRVGNVVATYTHLHALAVPDWAAGMVSAAVSRRAEDTRGCAKCG
jgi:cobyrinic acid a,c-diamide synthase